MNALGRHILAELYGCDPEILNQRLAIEIIMVVAALMSGAEIREVAFQQFSPQGVSGMVIISESHLAIHTWPEHEYASVDVYTCGDTVDPRVACDLIAKALHAESREEVEILRGVIPQRVRTLELPPM